MSSNTLLSRRAIVAGLPLVMAGCANPLGGDGGARIDARVDATLDFMYDEFPETIEIAELSKGMLVMPVVTEAGFGFGGGYGRGALRIQNRTADYYSTARASAGIQIGAQQYAHTLFFMTDSALEQFRRSDGFALGVDAEVTFLNRGESLATETTVLRTPILAIVFGQAGLRIGATIEGTKYTRIIP